MIAIKLNKVVLNTMDTCVSYALKRIRCFDESLLDYEKLLSGDVFEVFSYREESLLLGDIILWDSYGDGIRVEYQSTEITEDGKLIFNKVYQGYHLGVYEGNGFFSDCTRDYFYPYIRLRRIETIKADKILRKKS